MIESCFSGAAQYAQLGWEHILRDGTDHVLYIIVLCAAYSLKDWRKVGILVTAFTVGHSLTLALATLDLLQVNRDWVEFFIPVTIVLTAISHFFMPSSSPTPSPSMQRWVYLLTLLFGLIHGMGFSNYLRMLLGEAGCLWGPLLMFNIGLEVGQLIVVGIVLVLAWFVVVRLGLKRRYWTLGIATVGGLWALWMVQERWATVF